MTDYTPTQAPDDQERFHLDEDGYAFVQERCSGCGEIGPSCQAARCT